MRRRAGAAVLLVLAGTFGCGSSDGDRRDAYCQVLEEKQPALTRTADEAGAGAFLVALTTLEELAAVSPGDLEDEWQLYLGALQELRDTLDAADLDPNDLAGGLPAGLDDDTAATVDQAVRNVRSERTRAAATAITQQALDVCGVQIL